MNLAELDDLHRIMAIQRKAMMRYGISLPVYELVAGATETEKRVRAPLLASCELKNQPSSILPGHMTRVADPITEGIDHHLEDRKAGMAPMGSGKPAPVSEPKPTIPNLVSISTGDATRRTISGLA